MDQKEEHILVSNTAMMPKMKMKSFPQKGKIQGDMVCLLHTWSCCVQSSELTEGALEMEEMEQSKTWIPILPHI